MKRHLEGTALHRSLNISNIWSFRQKGEEILLTTLIFDMYFDQVWKQWTFDQEL